MQQPLAERSFEAERKHLDRSVRLACILVGHTEYLGLLGERYRLAGVEEVEMLDE